MHRRSVSVIVLAFTLASVIFRIESTTAIARNRVWFEVTHHYWYGTDKDIVTNAPLQRWHGWLFNIQNLEDETRQAITNPSINVVTELKFVNYYPEPAISDGEYDWNFHLELPESLMIPVEAQESNYTDFHSPGFSAERQVSPEILVDPVTRQNLSLTFTLEEPLPAEVNNIEIILKYPWTIFNEERLVNYTVLWLNDVQDWTAETVDRWRAKPSDLMIGKTYHFQAILEVVKSPKFGVLIAKPQIHILYCRWNSLEAVVGSSATATHPYGPTVTMSAEGNYEWYPNLCYSRQDFTFDPVEKPTMPPSVDFVYHPETSWVNEPVMFNASASSSSYNLTSYLWDFGDGNTTATTIPTIDHIYGREGRYTVALNVSDVYGLWNVTSCPVAVTFGTDLNRDCNVNIVDITIVAVAYNAEPGDQSWNSLADLDKNAIVNIVDVSMVAKDYGKTV